MPDWVAPLLIFGVSSPLCWGADENPRPPRRPRHHEVDISGWDMTNVALFRRDCRDKEQRQAIEAARALLDRDTWLSNHIRETRDFIEERRVYALGDPGDEA